MSDPGCMTCGQVNCRCELSPPPTRILTDLGMLEAIGGLLVEHRNEIRALIAYLRTEQQEMRAEVHAMMGREDPRNSVTARREGPDWRLEMDARGGIAVVPNQRPTSDMGASMAETYRQEFVDELIELGWTAGMTRIEGKIALARALRQSVCVCKPKHREKDPICQWKD